MQIYNSLVMPILTHNIHALALKKRDEDMLNGFHRRQLREILGDRNNQQDTPCTETYTRTDQRALTVDITKQRWKFLGHLNRQPITYLANDMMARSKIVSIKNPQTHISLNRKKTGRTITSMDLMLISDIKRINEHFPRIYETMDIPEDLKHKMLTDPKAVLAEKKMKTLRTIAGKRTIWKELVQAATTAKNREWYENYYKEKDIEPPPRHDKPENNSTAPMTPRRLYRYQEDNPRYIDK